MSYSQRTIEEPTFPLEFMNVEMPIYEFISEITGNIPKSEITSIYSAYMEDGKYYCISISSYHEDNLLSIARTAKDFDDNKPELAALKTGLFHDEPSIYLAKTKDGKFHLIDLIENDDLMWGVFPSYAGVINDTTDMPGVELLDNLYFTIPLKFRDEPLRNQHYDSMLGVGATLDLRAAVPEFRWIHESTERQAVPHWTSGEEYSVVTGNPNMLWLCREFTKATYTLDPADVKRGFVEIKMWAQPNPNANDQTDSRTYRWTWEPDPTIEVPPKYPTFLFEDGKVGFFEYNGYLWVKPLGDTVYLSIDIGEFWTELFTLKYPKKLKPMYALKPLLKDQPITGWHVDMPHFGERDTSHTDFVFTPPSLVVVPPDEETLFENEDLEIKVVGEDVVGVADDSSVRVFFIYNGRIVHKYITSKEQVLFSVADAKEWGLEIHETRMRIDGQWETTNMNTMLFESNSPNAGAVTVIDPCVELEEFLVDHEYIKMGIVGDFVKVVNCTTEKIKFKILRPAEMGEGFIISASVPAGGLKTFPARYLNTYAGKTVSFEWNIYKSLITDSVDVLVT